MIFIETQRLILRSYEEGDLPKFHRMNQDEKVMEFYPYSYDISETKNFINLQNQSMQENGFGFFVVEEKNGEKFIGIVGLKDLKIGSDFDGEVEIGWRIIHEKWNQGIATEAAMACLEYGFKEKKFEKIIAITAKINKKSQRIMEKIGMKFECEFLHPKIEEGHRLKNHVLYRINAQNGVSNFIEN